MLITPGMSENSTEELEAAESTKEKTKQKSPSELLADYAIKPEHCFYDAQGRLEGAAGKGAGLRFIGTYFPMATKEIQIATSYFRLGAYDWARKFIAPNTKINVLVGQEQGEQLKKAVVKEMTHAVSEIMHELGTTPVPLADAVAELIGRIRSGKFLFYGAYEMNTEVKKKWRRFHCKFYIVDNAIMWSGSANFTQNGLSSFGNDEQLEALRDLNNSPYAVRL